MSRNPTKRTDAHATINDRSYLAITWSEAAAAAAAAAVSAARR